MQRTQIITRIRRKRAVLKLQKNKTETQATRKTYSNASEYRTYLTKKYDCLKSSDYSVTINSSLLTDLKKMFKRLLMI